MNILMLTNTYKPIVGGLERSIETSYNEFRKRGHRVVIVAPEYEGSPEEEDVIRIPAIQNFNGTDFSVQVPIPGILRRFLNNFSPDIVHVHHPFLIGDTALRIASTRRLPLVLTFHTLYEKYTHYVPGNSQAMKKFVIALSTGYANLCDEVIVPSRGIEKLLRKEGVQKKIDVIPTGVYVERFGKGNGARFRERMDIPHNAFVVGFVSRVASEKNIAFLARAVELFLKNEKDAHFLIVGDGPSREEVRRFFERKGLKRRVHLPGVLRGENLIDAYHAMDIFAFASYTETQGLVIEEAMAAGVPVIALDAFGVNEVVEDGVNGRLLEDGNEEEFCLVLTSFKKLPQQTKDVFKANACKTARRFSASACARKQLDIYNYLTRQTYPSRNFKKSSWREAMRRIKAEWELIMNMSKAAQEAIKETKLQVADKIFNGAR